MVLNKSYQPLPYHASHGQCPPSYLPVEHRQNPLSTSRTGDVTIPPDAIGTSSPNTGFYITRMTGLPVPLIAADELPQDVHLREVPRELRWDQVQGMQYVGTFPPTSFTYQSKEMTYDNAPLPQTHHTNVPNFGRIHGEYNTSGTPAHHDPTRVDNLRFERNSVPSNIDTSDGKRVALSNQWRRPSPSLVAQHESRSYPRVIIDAIRSSKSRPAIKKDSVLPASGKLPDQDKKEYCTHWIRTGECDYTQQGCLYKHEMPDKATLTKIGFRATPQWWLEKHAAIKPILRKDNIGLKTSAIACKVVDVSRPVKKLSYSGSTSDDTFCSDEEEGMTMAKSHFDDRGQPERNDVETSTSARRNIQDHPNSKSPQNLTDKLPNRAMTFHRDEKAISSKTDFKHSDSQLKRTAKSEDTDLIDFKPLIPTSSPSSTGATTTSSSRSSTPSSSGQSELALDQEEKKRQPTGKKLMVFVPKGESAGCHLTAATTAANAGRARRGTVMLTPNVVTKPSRSENRRCEAHSQHEKEQRVSTTTVAGTVRPSHRGLVASKHAPSTSTSSLTPTMPSARSARAPIRASDYRSSSPESVDACPPRIGKAKPVSNGTRAVRLERKHSTS
ncbi:hypothetical protein K431DRAFT_332179 [Polychaeton citri CBS 116435]|uniref:C3H1-type domain-containing protein n=1 Tax=Polychaeton citri CBS 116435 TaxID=1314669 RepID=A0A9P4Q2W3_9PEZI|nr:hypothetical protein K431DRAFT_332179 [Polychaeton citri CBS 116435]